MRRMRRKRMKRKRKWMSCLFDGKELMFIPIRQRTIFFQKWANNYQQRFHEKNLNRSTRAHNGGELV
jgi:hypothetical protein